jgi:hypothetical protein
MLNTFWWTTHVDLCVIIGIPLVQAGRRGRSLWCRSGVVCSFCRLRRRISRHWREERVVVSFAGVWFWEQFGEVKTRRLALAALGSVDDAWGDGAGLVAVVVLVVLVGHNGRFSSPQSHVADGRI